MDSWMDCAKLHGVDGRQSWLLLFYHAVVVFVSLLTLITATFTIRLSVISFFLHFVDSFLETGMYDRIGFKSVFSMNKNWIS
jgi:predicted acetyltransferase